MALEESERNSLTHYLAALDLCMLAEGNCDKWRLAALFEETGETYLRVISECLKPVDTLTTKLVKGLGGSSEPKKDFLKQKLMMGSSGQDRMLSSHNILNEYQVFFLFAIDFLL
jgi:nucleoporin NDC1